MASSIDAGKLKNEDQEEEGPQNASGKFKKKKDRKKKVELGVLLRGVLKKNEELKKGGFVKDPKMVEEASKYVGVHVRGGMFRAELKRPGSDFDYIVGFFYKTAKRAALAYDREAYRVYGSQATLNFPHLIPTYMARLLATRLVL